jgi:AraC family transcriptional regulator
MSSVSPERFEDGNSMLLGGLRRRHGLTATETSIAEQWRQFMARAEIPGRVGSNLYGVMCGGDSTGFEYMCGVEVESFAGLAEGTGRMRVPAQRYAVFTHPGSAATLRFTWQRIFGWLASSSYASAHKPDFEVYGPGTDPLTAADGIEVWVGVVSKDLLSPEDTHG